MPLYFYRCPACQLDVQRIAQPNQANNPVVCPDCTVQLVRAPKPPTTRTVETIDNGVMSKPLEILKDATEIMKQRSKDFRRKDS